MTSMIKGLFSKQQLPSAAQILTETLEFSVIIPCYQDETALDGLLNQLQKLPNRPLEIIVVDGASSKLCQKICAQYHVQWLASEPNRGHQLLVGAALARGNVLWFLHADTRLPSDPLIAMTQAFDRGAIGGYFRFCFDTPRAWPALILEPAIALRCRIGTPYGDQGIFILQQIYTKIGGHAPWPLFEESPLVRGARQVGNFIALSESILVNPRRWQRDGWWRRTWYNRQLALSFACGTAPDKLASRYHLPPRSRAT